MDTAFFDPLKFFDDLKAADVPEKQARVQAETMRSALAAYDAGKMKELATKDDLLELRSEMRTDNQKLRSEMQELRSELQALRSKMQDEILPLHIEIKDTETRLLKWIGIVALLTQAGLMIALLAFIFAVCK